MTSDTDLDLIFKNAAGKKITLNIEEPKSGLTKAEIDAAMKWAVVCVLPRWIPLPSDETGAATWRLRKCSASLKTSASRWY